MRFELADYKDRTRFGVNPDTIEVAYIASEEYKSISFMVSDGDFIAHGWNDTQIFVEQHFSVRSSLTTELMREARKRGVTFRPKDSVIFDQPFENISGHVQEIFAGRNVVLGPLVWHRLRRPGANFDLDDIGVWELWDSAVFSARAEGQRMGLYRPDGTQIA